MMGSGTYVWARFVGGRSRGVTQCKVRRRFRRAIVVYSVFGDIGWDVSSQTAL